MTPQVGKRGMVVSRTLGQILDKGGKKLRTFYASKECTVESINEQGVVCLLFETKSGPVRECFKLGDPELDIEWR